MTNTQPESTEQTEQGQLSSKYLFMHGRDVLYEQALALEAELAQLRAYKASQEKRMKLLREWAMDGTLTASDPRAKAVLWYGDKALDDALDSQQEEDPRS